MQTALQLYVAASIKEATLPDTARTPSTDVQHIVRERFGIEDARELQQATALKAVGDTPRIFVLASASFTVEAQNALLKLFEDIPERVHIYVVVPHESVFIPTVLSRFITIERSDAGEDKDLVAFMGSPYSERLAIIQEKTKAKDHTWGERLVAQIAEDKSVMESAAVKQAVALVERYISHPGASRKMLLEELALTLPIKK